MSGIIGAGAVRKSGIIGNFPAGHVIQTVYSTTSSSDWDQDSSGYIGDTIPSERMLHSATINITSGNYVLVKIDALIANAGKDNNENYVEWFMSGGSIPTTSGKRIGLDYQIAVNLRHFAGGNFLDTAPGSTSPTYGLYIGAWSTTSGNHRYNNNGTYIYLQEIQS